MLVEFLTLRDSDKEAYEKVQRAMLAEKNDELLGGSSAAIPYENEEDFTTRMVLDMDTVVDFQEVEMHYNGIPVKGVICKLASDMFTRNILIDFEDFKRIFCLSRPGISEIKKAEDI